MAAPTIQACLPCCPDEFMMATVSATPTGAFMRIPRVTRYSRTCTETDGIRIKDTDTDGQNIQICSGTRTPGITLAGWSCPEMPLCEMFWEDDCRYFRLYHCPVKDELGEPVIPTFWQVGLIVGCMDEFSYDINATQPVEWSFSADTFEETKPLNI